MSTRGPKGSRMLLIRLPRTDTETWMLPEDLKVGSGDVDPPGRSSVGKPGAYGAAGETIDSWKDKELEKATH